MIVTVIVVDSFGIGELDDAANYSDEGANTTLHICETIAGAKWPNLTEMGLGNGSSLLNNVLPGCPAVPLPIADYAVLGQRSPGKDSTTGHWEIAGIVLDTPFTTFPEKAPSFPRKLIEAIERDAQCRFIGNEAASGTEIIGRLGQEHLDTGHPICYTAADSVFQIAAHERVMDVEELYKLCMIARRHCDEYRVARVIARPFIGRSGAFRRTLDRRDFSMEPPDDFLMSELQRRGVRTTGIGKIGDLFAHKGLDDDYDDKGNEACLDRLEAILEERRPSSEEDRFLFVNLVETDMVYGHRRDVSGYYEAVCRIDERLESVIARLNEEDSLLITADHGCDPTFRGTDHTREYVPLLRYPRRTEDGRLGLFPGHDTVARMVLDAFGLPSFKEG